MATMLEAMISSGLLQGRRAEEERRQEARRYEKTVRKHQHDAWKARCSHNRYGDIALFEIWDKTQSRPKKDSCALCGSKQFRPILWSAPNGRSYSICKHCYLHEAKEAKL